eukprot:6213883-Pleurochrysis_carterae.AAC.1
MRVGKQACEICRGHDGSAPRLLPSATHTPTPPLPPPACPSSGRERKEGQQQQASASEGALGIYHDTGATNFCFVRDSAYTLKTGNHSNSAHSNVTANC